MRNKIFQLSLSAGAAAVLFFGVACKSGPKDADLEKAVNDKASAISGDVSGFKVVVKDGVATFSGAFKDEASKEAFETTVKAIPGIQSVVDNAKVTPPPPPSPAPMVINGDDVLTKGVADATKDFPTVKASVKDSVITLTGEISRAKLQTLMMTIHSLHPKKVQNQLKIK